MNKSSVNVLKRILIYTSIVGLYAVSVFALYKLGRAFFIYSFVYPKIQINVSGTGSMYPTFPKGKTTTIEEKEKEIVASPIMISYPNGITIGGKSYYKSTIQRGDIVSFDYGKKALLKRIIGLPGEEFELRDGIVYINGTPQKEPYTAVPHSTFGGESISECKKITIPQGQYIVLGDNRKESDDSRFNVGLVNESSIHALLPLTMQTGDLVKNWRDTTKDLDDSTKIKLNISSFIDLLNKARIENKLDPLSYKIELEKSSALRSKNIFDTGIFDENHKGSLLIEQSIKDVGYWRPVYGEIPVQGYYDAAELFNYLFQFDKTQKLLLDKDFDELGITVAEGSLNNCPTQLIVIHFAGYVPPNYDQAKIKSWEKLIKNLEDVLPGWEKAKGYPLFYEQNKRDVDKIISIINDRINYLKPLVTKMKNNEWLTDEDLKTLNNDVLLDEEQTSLAKKLNDL